MQIKVLIFRPIKQKRNAHALWIHEYFWEYDGKERPFGHKRSKIHIKLQSVMIQRVP